VRRGSIKGSSIASPFAFVAGGITSCRVNLKKMFVKL